MKGSDISEKEGTLLCIENFMWAKNTNGWFEGVPVCING
jgi:hypothetical protein